MSRNICVYLYLYVYVCMYVNFCILPRMLVSVFRSLRNRDCYYFSRWSISGKQNIMYLIHNKRMPKQVR